MVEPFIGDLPSFRSRRAGFGREEEALEAVVAAAEVLGPPRAAMYGRIGDMVLVGPDGPSEVPCTMMRPSNAGIPRGRGGGGSASTGARGRSGGWRCASALVLVLMLAVVAAVVLELGVVAWGWWR